MQPTTRRLLAVDPRGLHLALVLIMLAAASLSIAVSQIALGLALALLIWRRLRDRQKPDGLGLGAITLALAGWALLTIPFSGDPAQSLLYYRRFYLFTAIWAVAAAADTEARRRWLLLALLAGSLAFSLYGLACIQRETGRFWLVRLDQMSNAMTSGCVLMMVLLVVLGFVLTPGRALRSRLALGLAALPLAFGLLQTMTRSAWLGLIAGLAAMLLLVRPRLCGSLVLALLAAGLLLDRLPDGALEGRLADRLDLDGWLRQGNTTARLEMWQAGLRMIRARPWLGFGDRDLARASAPYYEGLEGDVAPYGHLHSNPIVLAVIWGLPGLALAVAHYCWQLVLLLRAWRGRERPPVRRTATARRGWALGAIGVWAGFGVAGLTEWYFGDAESMLLYLAILGAALGATRRAEASVTPASGPS